MCLLYILTACTYDIISTHKCQNFMLLLYHLEEIFMKRTILCLVVLVFGITLFTACGGSGSTAESEDKLVAVMELAYPPFETKDESGNPTGVSVDFIKDFGEYIGREVEIVNTAWDGLIPSLETDKADVIISSMTITDSRKEQVDFSDPYANAMVAILGNSDSDIESVEDLNQDGKKIAVKTGSTGHIYAQENLKNAELIVLADESACVTEVSQGKADGFIYDQLTIYKNNQNNPDTTKAVYIPFQDAEQWGVAVKKGDTELVNKLNEFIAHYSESGGFDELSEKYLSEEKKAFEQLDFKWFFDLT